MASLLRLVLALCFTFTTLVTAQDTVIPLVCHEGVQVLPPTLLLLLCLPNKPQIIGLPGTNVSNGTQSYGLTWTFIQDIMAAIPDSSNIALNYNRFPGNLSSQVTFVPECDEGVPALLEAISNYTTACPNTPIVLHGYSQGAVVVMNLLCGASSGNFPVTNPLDSSFASSSKSPLRITKCVSSQADHHSHLRHPLRRRNPDRRPNI